MWKRLLTWIVTSMGPWLLDLLARKSKNPTRRFAFDFRRRMKSRIILGKADTVLTKTGVDDLPWEGSDVYMGLRTMKMAQRSLMDILDVAQPSAIIGPDSVKEIRELVLRTSNILDEPWNLNVEGDYLSPGFSDFFKEDKESK